MKILGTAFLCFFSFMFAEDNASKQVPKEEELKSKEWQDYFGTPVSTGPFPGVRSDYQGTNLMINLSSVNKGLEILKQQQQFLQNLEQTGNEFWSIPRLFLSGLLEVDTFYKQLASGAPESNIELSSSTFAGVVMLSRWLTAYMEIKFDTGVSEDAGIGRVANSRILGGLNFICLGDLEYYPYILTVGQAFAPFGQFTSFYPIQNPLTKTLFRTLARDAILTFYNDTILFNVFAFKGPAHTGSGDTVNNGGVDLTLNYKGNNVSFSFGGSLIRDVNSSTGVLAATFEQSTLNNLYTGRLEQYVPGIDARLNLGIGNITFLAEYCQDLRSYSPKDYTFNGKPAKVKAFDVEVGYDFKFFDYPATAAIGYTASYEALLFDVPKNRINASLSFNPIEDNILAIEFNSDKLYPKGTRYGGFFTNDQELYLVNENNLGKRDYSIAIDYQIFF